MTCPFTRAITFALVFTCCGVAQADLYEIQILWEGETKWIEFTTVDGDAGGRFPGSESAKQKADRICQSLKSNMGLTGVRDARAFPIQSAGGYQRTPIPGDMDLDGRIELGELLKQAKAVLERTKQSQFGTGLNGLREYSRQIAEAYKRVKECKRRVSELIDKLVKETFDEVNALIAEFNREADRFNKTSGESGAGKTPTIPPLTLPKSSEYKVVRQYVSHETTVLDRPISPAMTFHAAKTVASRLHNAFPDPEIVYSAEPADLGGTSQGPSYIPIFEETPTAESTALPDDDERHHTNRSERDLEIFADQYHRVLNDSGRQVQTLGSRIGLSADRFSSATDLYERDLTEYEILNKSATRGDFVYFLGIHNDARTKETLFIDENASKAGKRIEPDGKKRTSAASNGKEMANVRIEFDANSPKNRNRFDEDGERRKSAVQEERLALVQRHSRLANWEASIEWSSNIFLQRRNGFVRAKKLAAKNLVNLASMRQSAKEKRLVEDLRRYNEALLKYEGDLAKYQQELAAQEGRERAAEQAAAQQQEAQGGSGSGHVRRRRSYSGFGGMSAYQKFIAIQNFANRGSYAGWSGYRSNSGGSNTSSYSVSVPYFSPSIGPFLNYHSGSGGGGGSSLIINENAAGR